MQRLVPPPADRLAVGSLATTVHSAPPADHHRDASPETTLRQRGISGSSTRMATAPRRTPRQANTGNHSAQASSRSQADRPEPPSPHTLDTGIMPSKPSRQERLILKDACRAAQPGPYLLWHVKQTGLPCRPRAPDQHDRRSSLISTIQHPHVPTPNSSVRAVTPRNGPTRPPYTTPSSDCGRRSYARARRTS